MEWVLQISYNKHTKCHRDRSITAAPRRANDKNIDKKIEKKSKKNRKTSKIIKKTCLENQFTRYKKISVIYVSYSDTLSVKDKNVRKEKRKKN